MRARPNGCGEREALETMAAQIPQIFLGRQLNGLIEGPLAIWHGPLPDANTVVNP